MIRSQGMFASFEILDASLEQKNTVGKHLRPTPVSASLSHKFYKCYLFCIMSASCTKLSHVFCFLFFRGHISLNCVQNEAFHYSSFKISRVGITEVHRDSQHSCMAFHPIQLLWPDQLHLQSTFRESRCVTNKKPKSINYLLDKDRY